MMNFSFRCLTFLFVLATSTVFGQVDFTVEPFTEPGSFPVLKNCVVDMDGDHLDDIVAISNSVMKVASQQHDGSFKFKSHFQQFKNVANWSICAGDIDANGFNDLIIGGQGAVSFIYADNNGSAYREEAKPDYIFAQRSNFVDIDNDGHLDAFICHDEDQNHPYRNDGNGNLILDQSLINTPADTPGNYESVWVDYDNDGDLDLHIAKCVQNADINDPNRVNLLYNNDGNGNFTEVGEAAGLADNDQSWVSMFEDFNNDGFMDVFTLNHETANQLMINNGNGTYSNITAGSGLAETPLSAYEGFAADFDNDGDIDILRDSPQQFYINNGDLTFTIVPTPITIGAIGDLNNDGFLDVVNGINIAYNNGNTNHWLRINTIGRESNRNGIGARVEAYGDFGIRIREVRATNSWSPMSTLGVHIGVGAYTQVDSVVVKWPSGLRSVINNPGVDQVLTIDELGCSTELVEIAVEGELELCEGDNVQLTAPAGFVYNWSTGETSQSITVTTSGGYNVTITSPDGCTSYSKAIGVKNLNDPISILAPEGLEFCGAPIRLQADTDQPVVWSTGDTTNTIWVQEEGDYVVSAVSECGDQVQSEPITVERLVVDAAMPFDTIVAEGTELLVLHVDGSFVLWYNDNDPGSPLLFVGNDFFISNVMENDTFWVQNLTILPNGQECYSERVPITVTIATSSSQDLPELLGLKVYPNPTRGQVHVSLKKSQLIDLKVRDLSGREIRNYRRADSDLYNLEGLAPGVYLLEINLRDQSVTQKIVVNH